MAPTNPTATTTTKNVFVTGFGVSFLLALTFYFSATHMYGRQQLTTHRLQPFPDKQGKTPPHNASHELTKHLPSTLVPLSRFNPTPYTINILNPTAGTGKYVKTEYGYIRPYITDLHAKHKDDVDLFVHLGMWDGLKWLTAERKAYKQGFSCGWEGEREEGRDGMGGYYMCPDAAGCVVNDGPACPWGREVPVGLRTGLDVDGIVEGANAVLEGGKGEDEEEGGIGKGREWLEVRSHADPGYFCCGFIYYESLANKYVYGTKGDVLFCHLPGEVDPESLEKAKASILAVIGQAVEDGVRERKGRVGLWDP